jgi:endo-1,4-beta-xylanase
MNKYILFVLLGIFALTGCESPLNSKAPASGASGAVVVSIDTPQTAGSATARTIYPALAGFTRYELSFAGPMAHAPVVISVGGNSPIELAVGTWTITAIAYSGETASARGSATVTISSGAAVSVSITLSPIPEGSNGTLNYSVASPSGATGNLTIQTLSGGAVSGGVIPLAAGTTSANTLSLPPGEYMLSVSLTSAGNYAGRVDVLHIYSGLTSEVSYTFIGDDFIGVETLNPEYTAFTNVAGTTVLPSNAATISAATAENNAVFAIVGGSTNVVTINASTGELTLVGSGEIRVSLVITTTGGVVTHIGTSASITIPLVSGVTVSPATVNVAKGGTRTFIATVTGMNPAQTVTWSVSDGGADTTINADGILSVANDESATALTVRATSTVDTTKSGTATVTVTGGSNPGSPSTFVPVTNITGVPTGAIAGTDQTLSGTVAPTNATNQTITWSVYNVESTGASIASGNTLRTTAAGTVTVRATITNGLSASSNYTQDFAIIITIVAPPFVPVTNITGVPDAATVGTDLALSGAVAPANATNQNIVWSIQSAESTGASIVSGNTLRTTAAGTVTVRATITNGLSASSNYTQDFVITVTPPMPSTPTGVTATAASSSSITVGWTTVTGAASYKVYRSSTSGGAYSLIGSPASNTYTDTGLSASTTYYYEVSAVNAGGESGQSGYVSVTTAPSTPTGITATAASSSSITVSWTTVTGATSYKVYRSSTSGGAYSLIGSPASNTYTDTGLSASTIYYYEVSAVNAGGESGQSGYVSVTTINPFVGTWNGTGGRILTFNANGTVTANWMGTGTYTCSGNIASMTFGSASKSVTISGNTFTWDGISFSRQQ